MAAPAAAAAAAPEAAQPPVAAQVVGNAFVQQYYQILHHSPELVHKFYHEISKLGRPEDDGSMSITTTMKGINEKILSFNYGDYRAEIRSVDAQESFKGGVQVLVTGYLTGKDNKIQNFSQSFFLAPQDRGYFVLNDIFRVIEIGNQLEVPPVIDVVDPVVPEQNPIPPVQEELVSQEGTSLEEVVESEVYNPPENGDIPVVKDEVPVAEEELPVAEVVDEVKEDSQIVIESDINVETAPKKSYASIVMDLKGRGVTFSPPVPAVRKYIPKSQEQAKPPPAPEADGQVPHSVAVDSGNNQDIEAEGYSIYIKGLPMNATILQLENEFKKFGPIRNGGIQVRSNRGFCFGFVEFEAPNAVEKALEASPITIGGRPAVVEEKRSTNSRGSNRGRFQSGRGSGFRNEGVRGRGNYGGGGRGYNNRSDFNNNRNEFGEFNNRNEFNSRGGPNRGGSSNRSNDGYQRSDSNNGRTNRGGPGRIANGTIKPMEPRVAASG